MGELDAKGAAVTRILTALVLVSGAAFGHVGSPDVFFDGMAGPYKVYVSVRTPEVIPGVAQVELRIPNGTVNTVRITPTPLTGPGAKFAPTADIAVQSPQDPQYYTGSLWMMSSGSWQVRVRIEGNEGSGELRVPVPALARSSLTMDKTLGTVLFGLMAFLVIGAVSIAGAASREGKLPPGVEAPPENNRRARIVMAMTAALVIGSLYLGDLWWKAEASNYSRIIFKPLGMKTSIGGGTLTMNLEHTGWFQSRDFSDLIADHGHLMHLFVVSTPNLARMWHLHPQQTSDGVFTHQLPSMPEGHYKLFADIVHRSGLAETVVAETDVWGIEGAPLTGDDSGVIATGANESLAVLSDGHQMILDNGRGIKPRQLTVMKFRIQDSAGNLAQGMELYLGMPGHAAVMKKDLSVFAHLHPTGTVPMAAVTLAQPEGSTDPHAGHTMQAALPAEVTFPYGFPQPGDYRLFVQVKRAGKVETGVFDVTVAE